MQIARPLLWPDLATLPVTDYLRPPSPKDYVPFSTSTVITGQQYFPAVLGDGAATAFVIDHGLATEAVYVFVRENVDGGRQLVDGTDFAVHITNANSVTVTALTGAPALHAWAAIVMSAQTVAAFAAGLTVTVGQVTGLQTQLDAIGTQVATVLALLADDAGRDGERGRGAGSEYRDPGSRGGVSGKERGWGERADAAGRALAGGAQRDRDVAHRSAAETVATMPATCCRITPARRSCSPEGWGRRALISRWAGMRRAMGGDGFQSAGAGARTLISRAISSGSCSCSRSRRRCCGRARR